MPFSPVVASDNIKNKYYRYLKTAFKMGEPYKKPFERLMDKGRDFSSGPFIDVTDAFTKGKSIRELINEGVLPKSFERIKMNSDRPLYKHQENALRKIAIDKRNLVVSTGTGSGKTESFMIPILRELAIESEAGTLNPGVRALLIYPMNALANDQTERLRELLSEYPEITFGVYTGQTKQRYEDALSEYMSLNQNQMPIPNELISRDQMIEAPPNILVTNYAMLEYLMLRPKESVFFDGEFAKMWKFIVFDEAHVYHGSTGIEVSMLFRRLKAKLGNREITYILTSATLGEKEDDPEVAQFAQKLCSAPFDKNDIVRADRMMPDKSDNQQAYPIEYYEKIARLKEADETDELLIQYFNAQNMSQASSELYDSITKDLNYWKIREYLKSPRTVSELSDIMGWTESQIADFITVASLAEKNDAKLFDARYHMFLRATESIFVTLAPDNKVLLDRTNYRYNEGENAFYKVFEVATCSYCSAIYLVGKIEDNRLEQSSFQDELSTKELFLLASSISDTDSDHMLEDEGIKADAYEICPYCGFLHKEGTSKYCEHSTGSYLKVYRVGFSNESRVLTKCLNCENVNTSGVLRMFFSGQEASTSVIGTALFEELPSYKITVKQNESQTDDDLDFEFGGESTAIEKEKTAKQFIAFSDSRQAAAFYASYLSISYNNILYKRLIMEVIKTLSGQGLAIPDFVDALHTEFQKHDVHGRIPIEMSSEYSTRKEAWKAVLAELIDSNGNTSLSRFGLMGISLKVDKGLRYDKYHISESEFGDLCSILANSMMVNAALNYNAPLNENDLEDFTHGGVEYTFTLSDANPKKLQKSFLPSKAGLSNARVDYIKRVLQRKGFDISNDDVSEFLKKLWEVIFIKKGLIVKKEGIQYRLDTNKIIISNPVHWYVCSKCKKLTCHNIENVCPAYRCDGELIEADVNELFSNNHYYNIYNNMEIRDLRVVEHSAQLDKDKAYEYQKMFKQKEIDVLSCSTTFEMGVDVGSLETVFMRNMPPMPSNYAQRAGRAGRSKQSAAFALTFCNKSSHDFSYFNDPTRMIKGKIAPPKYSVDNDRIAIRHLYAAVLSFFWKVHPSYFCKVGEFLTCDERGKTGFDVLKDYLKSRPENLKQYLLDFLPPKLLDKFGVETFAWVEGLVGEDGVLTHAIKGYNFEVSQLEEARQQRFENGMTVDRIGQRLKVYQKEDILSFMSRKNVLPKYGFPVDTVEMTVTDNKRDRGFGLQLQRDLSMAISEYAPDSQIVANNNLITSRYIKKIPSISWKMYSYVQCPHCKTLNIKLYIENDNAIEECCQCHMKFSESAPEVFIIPEQGFAADGNKITKPGLKKPQRTYRSEISYVGFNSEAEKQKYNIGSSIIEVLTSHNDEMAVLNTSHFYVCETCGYATVDKKSFTMIKKKQHTNAGGFPCGNSVLKRFSLGYRFLTDVVRIRFVDHEINDYDAGMSILHGLLRGISSYLNIEENDISGCLQSNPTGNGMDYSMVIFDNTPGGSGHAKRLNNPIVIEGVLNHTLNMIKGCTCGGDEGDSSCYSCLRSYKNQKYHDILKRKYVIEFLSDVLA